MKAIPTKFADTDFRSRLEARWAAFFDLIGWRWTYEPMDTSGYIPDFLIHGERPFFVEVGPCIEREDYEAKSAKPNAAYAELRHDVLIAGVSPLLMRGPVGGVAGWLGQYDDQGYSGSESFSWYFGAWVRCSKEGCGQFAVTHMMDSYVCIPCGHHDGDHYLGPCPPDLIERGWREAGNSVQWMKENR